MLNVKVLDITILENNTVLFNYAKILNNFYTITFLKKPDLAFYYYLMKLNTDKNLFLDYKEEVLEIKKRLKKPDVLVLYHYKLNNSIYNTLTLINQSYKLFSEDLKCFDSRLYNISFDDVKDLNEYKEEISFNGCKYKLDSVLLDNYNGGNYSMTGLHYNNEKYVYNGLYNNDCGLLKYDWNTHKNKEFCFDNKNCKLEQVNLLKYYLKNCYSFNKGDRILIYVKVNKNKSLSITSSIKSFSSL